MKYIAKRNRQVQCLHDANQSPPTSSQQAKDQWKDFRSKRELTNILLKEQLGLCAYTELRPDEVDIGTHLEHVKPKSKKYELTFDYKNLVVSALSSDDLGNPTHKGDLFAGHAKGNHYDIKQFMSPLSAKNKKSYFLYQSNGKVVPSPKKSKRYQKKAQHTINILKLNASYLVSQRRRWIEELDDLIDSYIDDGVPISDLAITYLIPRDQLLERFFSATRQRFGRVAETLLKV